MLTKDGAEASPIGSAPAGADEGASSRESSRHATTGGPEQLPHERGRLDELVLAVARASTGTGGLGGPARTARRVVDELASATGLPLVAVCRRGEDDRVEVVAVGGTLDRRRSTLDERALLERAVEACGDRGHALVPVEDLAHDRDATRAPARAADGLVVVCAAIEGEERPWGHLVLLDTAHGLAYAEAEMAAIRITAGIVAAAVRRAETERALRESEAMLLRSQKLETIGLLAGGVAHDFANTLMAVRGFAALIDEVTAEEETRSYALQILGVADRSSVLLRRLLDLARRDRHEPVVSDVSDLLSSLHTLLDGVVPRSIDLSVEVDPSTPLVGIDPGEFEQIVLNLVVNACDALPGGGTVAIRAGAASDGGLELVVSDTGTGIDPEALGRIFDPFFTTKDRARGSGIGLTVVQGIVARAGGTIGARSVVGGGSTFVVALPAADASSRARDGERSFDREPVSPADGRHRVLLVEDDDRLRSALGTLLRQHGHDVVSVPSGDAALGALARRHGCFDVVVTDVVMPGMDGRALAADVHRLYPELAVVLMSGYECEVGPAPAGTSLVPKHKACSELLDAVERAIRPRTA